MKIFEFERLMNEIAPLELKESFDNVGLMIGESETEITNILAALDCTLEVIDEAVEKKCNVILTHHPILFRKPNCITDKTLQGRKILKLIKNDIAVYSSHTNLDAIEGGINDVVVDILGLDQGEILAKNKFAENINIKAGIGRLVTLEKEVSLKDILNLLKEKLNLSDLRFCGDLHKKIKKISIINGSGQDFFEISKIKEADVIITGDTSYHFVSDFNEENIAIVDIGHFPSEFAPLIKICNEIHKKLKNNDFHGEMIVSEKSKNPYKIF